MLEKTDEFSLSHFVFTFSFSVHVLGIFKDSFNVKFYYIVRRILLLQRKHISCFDFLILSFYSCFFPVVTKCLMFVSFIGRCL